MVELSKANGSTVKLLTQTTPVPQPSEKPKIVIPTLIEKIDEINPENQNIEDPNFSSTNQTFEIENLNSSSTEGNFTFPL